MVKKAVKRVSRVVKKARKIIVQNRPSNVIDIGGGFTAEIVDTPHKESPGGKKAVKKVARKSYKSSTPIKAVREGRQDQSAPHLIITARAGTGKTTTLVGGVNRIMGRETKGMKPTKQQEAIWQAMVQGDKPKSILFCAFNKSIAEELALRLPPGCNASTIHSLGNSAIRKAGWAKVSKWKITNGIESILEKDFREIMKDKRLFQMVKSVEALTRLAKQNLLGWNEEEGFSSRRVTDETLAQVAAHYGINLNGESAKICGLVRQLLDYSCEKTKEIDFEDMIWLPLVNNLDIPKYDLVLVDEAQDLNRCQQELVRKAGARLILCGDDRQAIYGFAGADTESIIRMREILTENGGCEGLALTMTFRCGKAIVARAKEIVADYEAFEGNHQGQVMSIDANELLAEVGKTDYIICRVNAPLVSQCLKLIARGRKAYILGRNIADQLIDLVEKMEQSTIDGLIGAIDDWARGETVKEQAKRNPDESKMIAIEDKKECIFALSESCKDTKELLAKIDSIFSDQNKEGIRLSSIHKAKGLEADNVFILRPDLLPHPRASTPWQVEQERNLQYVAITRAKERLIYVSVADREDDNEGDED
jgi:DNA helicase II / ATP-dependent DNA helicase PcrA